MSDINILNESTKLLRLQALGNCSSKCKKRLTKLELARNTKELLKQFYIYFSDMYFAAD